ncbi:hypothetical protein FGO68_gene738 [Halteria grandinella]|uniref:Uncharacterized protein n=1 Tax=Halteria grandinella TaxID=5974 RepID=A0A8J8SZM4_HALGN|nr:hypothetical protein FGO68_gene738 [Halteria grandinella]
MVEAAKASTHHAQPANDASKEAAQQDPQASALAIGLIHESLHLHSTVGALGVHLVGRCELPKYIGREGLIGPVLAHNDDWGLGGRGLLLLLHWHILRSILIWGHLRRIHGVLRWVLGLLLLQLILVAHSHLGSLLCLRHLLLKHGLNHWLHISLHHWLSKGLSPGLNQQLSLGLNQRLLFWLSSPWNFFIINLCDILLTIRSGLNRVLIQQSFVLTGKKYKIKLASNQKFM